MILLLSTKWWIPIIICLFGTFNCQQKIPAFDGERAFSYLTAQTDFGPRNPGSEGHQKCLDYLIAEFLKTADSVKKQPFTFTDDFIDSTYELTNVIASFNLNPPGARRILLTAHWDTRPFADQDPYPENRSTPILGANDGASGVAVLLEIAAVLKIHPPPVGVDIILFDGEDYGDSKVNDLDYFFLGSRYFTETMGEYRPEYAILLDMVGAKEAQFYIEGYSYDYAPVYVRRIWDKAKGLGFSSFVSEIGPRINDDHWIMNQAGIPSVDIIDINEFDFNYPHWHTIEDTPDKCSPETLALVGTLVLNVIYDY